MYGFTRQVYLVVMKTHDALNRRNRYHPSSTGKRVTLKPRDLEWLRFIARHGPLPSNYIHAFTEDTHPSAKATRMRLMDLSSENNTPHGGPYLIRPVQQQYTIDARNKPLVYDLSEHGWKALGMTRQDMVRASGPFQHQLLTACTTAKIELECKSDPAKDYIPASELLDHASDIAVDLTITNPHTGRPERHRLIPDQLFALRYHTPEGPRYRAYCVECDRGTEPKTSSNYARKSAERSTLQYREFIGRGIYKGKWGLKCPLVMMNINRADIDQNFIECPETKIA